MMAKQGELKVGDSVLISGMRSNNNARFRAQGKILRKYTVAGRDKFDIRAGVDQQGEIDLIQCDVLGLERVND